MISFSIALLCLGVSDYKQKGEEFGLIQDKVALKTTKHFSADDLYPSSQKGKEFDVEAAKRTLKHNSPPASEVLEFLKSPTVQKNANRIPIHPEELFLKKSEEVASNATVYTTQIIEDDKSDYYIEQCQLVGAPSFISLIRELKVEVVNKPEEQHIKICQGHKEKKKYFWKSDAEHAYNKLRKQFKEDPTIQEYDVKMSGGGTFSKYEVKSEWSHKKGCSSCNHFTKETKIIDKLEEAGETWEYNDLQVLAAAQSPDCTLVEQTCLDANATKNIEGKEVFRQCWKEQLIFQYLLPQDNNCAFLLQHNCKQIDKQCLKEGPLGCSLWKLKFQCFKKINRKTKSLENKDLHILGLEDQIEIEYEPNNSFSEVATKLAVFQEIQKDLKNAQEMDVSEIEIFKGRKMECSKSIASDLVYDCCFKYKGLAKNAHLAKCNSDELALADMQEQGLCHYVGSYDEKVLGIKTKDIHVFCSFPSKLSRVLHEKGRAHLGMEWGSPKHPNCRGFFVDQISQLDFSKLDLSEAFEQGQKVLPEHFDAKLKAFHKRILDDLAKENQEL